MVVEQLITFTLHARITRAWRSRTVQTFRHKFVPACLRCTGRDARSWCRDHCECNLDELQLLSIPRRHGSCHPRPAKLILDLEGGITSGLYQNRSPDRPGG